MGYDQNSEPLETPDSQPEAADSQLQQHGRSTWSILSALRTTLTILRKLMVNVAVLGSAVAVIAFFFSAVVDEAIIIEAPSVPKPVSDRGLTPELLMELLQARLHEVHDTAETSKSPETAGPGLGSISIQTGGLSFSLDSLALVVRRILGTEKVQKMRVICPTPDCRDDMLVLHAVSHADDVVLNTVTPLDTRDLAPALEVVSNHFLLSFDPHLLAMYHLRMAHSDPEKLDPGNLMLAEDIARKMVRERHPQAIWAYNVLGIIETRCGNYDVAEAYFNQALKMDGGFAPAMVNIGSIHARKKDRVKAISEYKRALATDPDNVFAHTNLGSAFMESGDWARATEAYERAFEIDPSISSVLTGLAKIKNHTGDVAAATSLEQLVEFPHTLNLPLNYVLGYSSYCF